MIIPPYWASAQRVVRDQDDTELDLRAWGWSLTGQAEAERRAAERLERMIERVRRGEPLPLRYPYGAAALREEIIREIRDAEGGVAGVITRNTYGALVVNAPGTLFIDVDMPEPTFKQRLRQVFGGKDAHADETFQSISDSLRKSSSATFRIYRTAAGFRVIGTERTYEPGSSETERLMSSVAADPAYVQLCRAQKTFRARLSPKPWRIGCHAPPGSHPRDAQTNAIFARWLGEYDERSAGKAVCRYLGHVGTGRVADGMKPILDLHDASTRAHQELPLA